jgi:hemolysin III
MARVTLVEYREPMPAVPASDSPFAKPLLRGVLHQGAFFVSLVVGTLLIVGSEGAAEHAAAAIFAGSVAACFGVSALYHRVNWAPGLRLWMRRVDHAGVYLLIAGTYTPVCVIALGGDLRLVVLGIVSAGAAAAILLKVVWVAAPNWLAAVIGIALGWVGVALLPELATQVSPAAIVLLGLGGIAYTLGAIVYARRRPNPAPTVFGYHELFHALTIVGVSCQYVAIAFFVIRAG